jgi:capsular polysaccharide biosynthesis protein
MSKIKNVHNDELQIDIFDVVKDIIKDWWLILVFGISAALCALVISDVLYTPSYAARATFAVTSKGANNTYDNLAAANMVASSLTNIFDGELIEKRVAMDIGTETIPDYISAEIIPETNLFVLTVSAPNPEIAYRIIISIMENYTSVTSYLYQNAILDVLETPTIPEYPNNPWNLNNIMGLAFLIGAFAMTLLLAVLSVTRDNIKNEKEISKKLDTKLIGVIYHEKIHKTLRSRLRRKKRSILITSPIVSFSFVENMKKIRSKIEYKASAKSQNVLLVTSVLENEDVSRLESW